MTKPETDKKHELTLTIFLQKDGNAWVAQCLEYDIAAQAPAIEEVKLRFMKTVRQQIMIDLQEQRMPLEDLGQAPEHFFDAVTNASQNGPELPVFIPVERKAMIRARASFLTGASSGGASAQL
jgi:hypothetical protein